MFHVEQYLFNSSIRATLATSARKSPLCCLLVAKLEHHISPESADRSVVQPLLCSGGRMVLGAGKAAASGMGNRRTRRIKRSAGRAALISYAHTQKPIRFLDNLVVFLPVRAHL